jgi:hypothetical protein
MTLYVIPTKVCKPYQESSKGRSGGIAKAEEEEYVVI